MSSAVNRSGARRGRPGYDVEQVLAAAVELFNAQGYDRTSIDDLARRLGVSKSAIYHHVSSKEELLSLAVDRALDGLFAAADSVDTVPGGAIERLETLVRRSVTVLVEQLPYVTLLLRIRGNTPVELSALQRRRHFDAIVASLVLQAERDGDIRPDIDPALAARLLFGLVNSLVEWYRPARGDDGSTIAEAVTNMAFSGLRTKTTPVVP